MTYKVATGYNQVGNLAAFIIPPRMEGLLEYPRRTVAGNGLIYADGYPQAALIWDYLDADDLAAILSACGLSLTTVSAQVTIEVPADAARTFDQYNAIIARPEFPSDIRYDRGKYTGPFAFNLTRMVLI